MDGIQYFIIVTQYASLDSFLHSCHFLHPVCMPHNLLHQTLP